MKEGRCNYKYLSVYIEEEEAIFLIILIFLLIVATSIYLTIKKQKAIFLSLPVFVIVSFVFVKIALVPAPFFETVWFIFSLQ